VSISLQDVYVTTGGFRVIRADFSHLDAIVKIHLATFKGFFLESLGREFLRELYRGFILEPSGLCLVAIDASGALIGFVAGTTQPEGFFRRLLRHRWYAFVSAGISSLFLHPILVGRKFVFALRYRGEKPLDIPPAALLSSIGVLPEGKRRGIGKTLVASFCEEVRKDGIPIVFLTTDRDSNDAVNNFYLGSGFKLHSSFLKELNRWTNLYTRSYAEVELGSEGISCSVTGPAKPSKLC
jgi:ribosomal protein S18 acetylase RimI-like enzyme